MYILTTKIENTGPRYLQKESGVKKLKELTGKDFDIDFLEANFARINSKSLDFEEVIDSLLHGRLLEDYESYQAGFGKGFDLLYVSVKYSLKGVEQEYRGKARYNRSKEMYYLYGSGQNIYNSTLTTVKKVEACTHFKLERANGRLYKEFCTFDEYVRVKVAAYDFIRADGCHIGFSLGGVNKIFNTLSDEGKANFLVHNKIVINGDCYTLGMKSEYVEKYPWLDTSSSVKNFIRNELDVK